MLPWQRPDLALRWVDPWASEGRDPFVQMISGPVRPDLVAFEVYGLLALRSEPVPVDFQDWLGRLDQKKAGMIPLAVAGKSDAELLSLILWLGEGVLGAQKLGESLEALSHDPQSGITEGGTLSPDHPWTSVLNEIRTWVALGRLAPNWWDYSAPDVTEAVAAGRARWGLSWSGDQFSKESGLGTTALSLVPTWPDRRSSTLVGRWLLLEDAEGWGAPSAREQARARFFENENPSLWLQQGLLLARNDLPAINQETKSLGQGLLSAGFLVSAPLSQADLSRWKPLLEAVRMSVR